VVCVWGGVGWGGAGGASPACRFLSGSADRAALKLSQPEQLAKRPITSHEEHWLLWYSYPTAAWPSGALPKGSRAHCNALKKPHTIPMLGGAQGDIASCHERRLEVAAALEGLEQLLSSNLRKQRRDLEDALAGSSLGADEGSLQERQAAAQAVRARCIDSLTLLMWLLRVVLLLY
jgi:hypothetical protein